MKITTVKIAEMLKNNPYFAGIKGCQIIYSNDFYVAMYKKIETGMTYVEAYNALGFDTALLGVNRANNVSKRVMASSKSGTLVNYTRKMGSVIK